MAASLSTAMPPREPMPIRLDPSTIALAGCWRMYIQKQCEDCWGNQVRDLGFPHGIAAFTAATLWETWLDRPLPLPGNAFSILQEMDIR